MSEKSNGNGARLKAPFPYFGGKRRVADLVWQRLGDVAHYVEPFFGSGAVLLARPHEPNLETVNDIDGMIVNFWRAVAADPEQVATYCYWPVNEVDLEARHRWLCKQPDKDAFLERMKHEPDYYDAKRAAWWCWGLCAWIGRGWCEGEYFPSEPGASHGCGVCDGASKRPHLGNTGMGVHRQQPHLGSGQGVHRQRPHLGNTGQGVHKLTAGPLIEWFQALAARLRRVRVCCGDWSRICTDGATAHGSTVGVFLDPPYSAEAGRDNNVYRMDCGKVAHEVRDWCIMRTHCEQAARYRIVLAGYEGEHNVLADEHGWSVHAWKAQGGYANFGSYDNERGQENAHRERLWFSPTCIQPQDLDGAQGELFASGRDLAEARL